MGSADVHMERIGIYYGGLRCWTMVEKLQKFYHVQSEFEQTTKAELSG